MDEAKKLTTEDCPRSTQQPWNNADQLAPDCKQSSNLTPRKGGGRGTHTMTHGDVPVSIKIARPSHPTQHNADDPLTNQCRDQHIDCRSEGGLVA